MFVLNWYALGDKKSRAVYGADFDIADYPYDTIEEAQEWWKGVDIPAEQKEAVGRANAIRLFKLPLDL